MNCKPPWAYTSEGKMKTFIFSSFHHILITIRHFESAIAISCATTFSTLDISRGIA